MYETLTPTAAGLSSGTREAEIHSSVLLLLQVSAPSARRTRRRRSPRRAASAAAERTAPGRRTLQLTS